MSPAPAAWRLPGSPGKEAAARTGRPRTWDPSPGTRPALRGGSALRGAAEARRGPAARAAVRAEPAMNRRTVVRRGTEAAQRATARHRRAVVPSGLRRPPRAAAVRRGLAQWAGPPAEVASGRRRP